MNTKGNTSYFALHALLLLGLLLAGTTRADYAIPASENNGQVRYLYPASADIEADYYAAQSDLVNNHGGGTIVFTSGTYSYSWIQIFPEIHVRYQPGVKVYLTGANARLFWFKAVNNTSVEGLAGAEPEIYLPELDAVFGDKMCHAITVDGTNWKIRNMKFYTRGTYGNIIGVGGTATSDGLIENVHSIMDTYPLHPGWSVIQCAVCDNLTVKNISADGGYTLRLEQDLGQVGTYGLRNVYAEGIVNYDGRGAVVLVPNGGVLAGGNQNITVTGIRSYGSSWGLCVGDKTYEGDLGTYENSAVFDIECHYGLNAQFRKYPERSYLPADQLALVTDLVHADFIEFCVGPSLGVVFNNLTWCTVADARGYDFPPSYGIANSDPSTASPIVYNYAETTALTVDVDAYVRGGDYADINYGTEPILACKTASTDKYTRHTYLKIKNLDDLEPVTKAVLRLKVASSTTSGDTYTAYVTSDDWGYKTITWNNKPAAGAALDSAAQVATGEWIEFDVTGAVQAEQADNGKLGIVIISGGSNYIKYHSVEAAEAAEADRPQLVVTTGGSGNASASSFVIFDDQTVWGWDGSSFEEFGPTSDHLVNIDVGEDNVPWGINAAGTVYSWGGSGWTQRATAGQDVAVGGGKVFLTKTDDSIWEWNGSSFVAFSGGGALAEIDVGDDGVLWGINAAGSIWSWNGSWSGCGSGGQDIGVGGGNVFLTKTDDSIWEWNGSSFVSFSGGGALEKVDVGEDGLLWGINAAGNIYAWTGNSWSLLGSSGLDIGR